MKEQGTGGSILTIASVAAHCAVPGKVISGYCATKGGVLALTRAMADELIPYNIRVNSISPGYGDSESFISGRNVLMIRIDIS